MTMPGRWADAGLRDFRGGLRCVRPFGFPGRIDDFERVWLTFDGVEGSATVTLNERVLGTIRGPEFPAEFEITSLLRQRNNLHAEVECTEPSGGLWGEVALEIRATAFLRDIRFEVCAERLTARGVVVGEAQRPLELYLFADDRFLTYERVELNDAKSQSFILAGDLRGAALPSPMHARVELIDTAVIWYVAESTVDVSKTSRQ
jgi:hypothetical protein